jgi:hypothetical protein
MRDARVTNIRIVDATGSALGARVAERLAAPLAAGRAGPDAQVDVDRARRGVDESTLVAAVQAREETGGSSCSTRATAAGRRATPAAMPARWAEVEVVENAVRAALLASRIEARGSTRPRPSRSRGSASDSPPSDHRPGQGRRWTRWRHLRLRRRLPALHEHHPLRPEHPARRARGEDHPRGRGDRVERQHGHAARGQGDRRGRGGLTQMLIWVASGVLFWEQRSRVFTALGMQGMPTDRVPDHRTAGARGAPALLPPRLHLLRLALRGRRRDGRQSGGGPAGLAAGAHAAHLQHHLRAAGDDEPHGPPGRGDELDPVLGADHHADAHDRHAGATRARSSGRWAVCCSPASPRSGSRRGSTASAC